MKVSSKMPNAMQNAEAAKSSKASGPEALLDVKDTNSSKKSAPSAGVAGSSRVDVSSRAQDMMRAKELATPSDDVNEAKVARLQKMIDEGRYKVDAEAIADRILDEQSKMPT